MVDEVQSFLWYLLSLKEKLENGMSIDDLNDAAQKKVKIYFIIRTWGKKTIISINEKACAQAEKYHGYLVLVSDGEKDTF